MSKDVEPMSDAGAAHAQRVVDAAYAAGNPSPYDVQTAMLLRRIDELREDVRLLDEVETDFHCGVTRDGRALGGVWETLMMRTDTTRRIKERRKAAAEAAMKEQNHED